MTNTRTSKPTARKPATRRGPSPAVQRRLYRASFFSYLKWTVILSFVSWLLAYVPSHDYWKLALIAAVMTGVLAGINFAAWRGWGK